MVQTTTLRLDGYCCTRYQDQIVARARRDHAHYYVLAISITPHPMTRPSMYYHSGGEREQRHRQTDRQTDREEKKTLTVE